MPTINQLVREGRKEVHEPGTAQGYELPQKSSHRYQGTSEERRMHICKDRYP